MFCLSSLILYFLWLQSLLILKIPNFFLTFVLNVCKAYSVHGLVYYGNNLSRHVFTCLWLRANCFLKSVCVSTGFPSLLVCMHLHVSKPLIGKSSLYKINQILCTGTVVFHSKSLLREFLKGSIKHLSL